MFETVSVDEALRRGRKMITYPVQAIMIGMLLVSVTLTIVFNNGFPLLGIVAGFVMAWLYWSLMITKWRIWAFTNVRNVHELKKRAVKEKLIWKDGSWFGKTEIWNPVDKQNWAALQDKFNIADVFHDDFSVPSETEIRYSRNKILVEVFLGLLVSITGVYLWVSEYNKNFGIGLGIVGLIIIFMAVRKMNNKKAQVILSDKGIQTAKTQFYEWKDVDHEDVVAVQTGKTRINYLMYNYPHGIAKFDIRELDVSKPELERLLRLYRGRYQKNAIRV